MCDILALLVSYKENWEAIYVQQGNICTARKDGSA